MAPDRLSMRRWHLRRMSTHRPRRGFSSATVGTGMALLSAAVFGSSGPMAKALLESGWTAGAVVLARLSLAAVLLAVIAAVTLRRPWRLTRTTLRILLLYGFIAMAGVQLAYFNAVRTLDVAVALLIEYLAPVLLLVWTSVRDRALPQLGTLVGAALALAGLALVLDLRGTTTLDPGGVVWALVAAVCLAAFFIISDRQHADLPPAVMAAGGTAIGAVVIAVAGAMGAVPLRFSTADAVLAGNQVSWILPAVWLAVVATVIAYLAAIGGIVRLGTRSASFLALTEVLFAVGVAWLLLGELPGPIQLAGGLLMIAGIVLVRAQERARAQTELEPAAG